MNKLLEKLGIDETLTKPVRDPKKWDKVADNVPHVPHYNYMADLLELPKTKEGYQYLLACVDLGTNKFDIEPLKTKTAPAVLDGFQRMFKRKYIKEPYISVRTDGGPEFKSVFHKYLYEKNVLHSVAHPYRHRQLANVESLNRQLGRLFNGYMNAMEEKTAKPYREWTDVLNEVRDGYNKLRKSQAEDPREQKVPLVEDKGPSKFKVGDIVHYKLDYPESALAKKQSTANFRMGDYRFAKCVR